MYLRSNSFLFYTFSFFLFFNSILRFSLVTLSKNPHWFKLIDYAESHDALLVVNDAYQPLMPLMIAQAKQTSTSSSSKSKSKSNSSLDLTVEEKTLIENSYNPSSPTPSSSSSSLSSSSYSFPSSFVSSTVIYPAKKKVLKTKKNEKFPLQNESEGKDKEPLFLPSSSSSSVIDNLPQVDVHGRMDGDSHQNRGTAHGGKESETFKRNLEIFLESDKGQGQGLPSNKRCGTQLSELEEGEEGECE